MRLKRRACSSKRQEASAHTRVWAMTSPGTERERSTEKMPKTMASFSCAEAAAAGGGVDDGWVGGEEEEREVEDEKEEKEQHEGGEEEEEKTGNEEGQDDDATSREHEGEEESEHLSNSLRKRAKPSALSSLS